MKKRNQITQAAILTIAGVSALNVGAQEVETGTVSVTIQNAFTLTQVAPLSFGTVRATTDDTNIATFVIPSNPNTAIAPATNNGASIVSIVDGTPAQWSIADVSGFAILNIEFPATGTVEVSGVGLPPGTPGFDVENFDAYITSGPNANRAYNTGTPNLQADIDGEVTFNVGASLLTQASATAYFDGSYTGSYTLTVNYQ